MKKQLIVASILLSFIVPNNQEAKAQPSTPDYIFDLHTEISGLPEATTVRSKQIQALMIQVLSMYAKLGIMFMQEELGNPVTYNEVNEGRMDEILLETAREKGTIAAIKANLSGLRAEAELYYDTARSYGPKTKTSRTCTNMEGTLFDDMRTKETLRRIQEAYPQGKISCGTKTLPGEGYLSSEYVVRAELPREYSLDTKKYFCVDSTGKASEQDSFGGDYQCEG